MGGLMDIVVTLKSRVLSCALYEVLKGNEVNEGFNVWLEDDYPLSRNPEMILTDQHHLGEKLLARETTTKVLLIDSGLGQEEVINLLVTHKLDGVLSPEADIGLLKKAIKLLGEGQIWIDNTNLKALLNNAGNVANGGKIDEISSKEQQIMEFIKKGCKNKEIAAELFLSEQTIKAHLSRIFRKFNVSSRSQLISLLMKN